MNAKVISLHPQVNQHEKYRVEFFTVKELKKMLKYAEKHEVQSVKVACSNETGIGVSKTVSKNDGSHEFDVTDVSVW